MATKKSPTQMMFMDDEDTVVNEQKEKINKQTREQQKQETPVLEESQSFLSLPSKGLLGYPTTVSYRDILVKDEEKLSMTTVETYAKTLNSVLKGILNGCEFFEKMSIHDRDYCLVWLWANNYESHKKVEHACQHCGHKNNVDVDLSAVEVEDIKDNIKIPFEIPLEEDGKKIFVRMSTVGDELLVEEFLSKGKNRENYSYETLMLTASIDVGMEIPFDRKVQWVRENISAKTIGYVRKFHSYFKFGVKNQIENVCEECGGVSNFALPFRPEDVLFPTPRDDFEKLL